MSSVSYDLDNIVVYKFLYGNFAKFCIIMI